MPTFNDLYYQEVGNRSLKPEKTQQFDIGMTYNRYFAKNKIHLSLIGDLYYNLVKDKIVAIPSKNLFVWSMINYGKVEILGIEGGLFFSWRRAVCYGFRPGTARGGERERDWRRTREQSFRFYKPV